jgi:hypothetical protein
VTDPTGPRPAEDEDDHTTAPIPAELARELVAAASQINAALATGDEAPTVPVSVGQAKGLAAAAADDDAATIVPGVTFDVPTVALTVARQPTGDEAPTVAVAPIAPAAPDDAIDVDIDVTGETTRPAPPAPAAASAHAPVAPTTTAPASSPGFPTPSKSAAGPTVPPPGALPGIVAVPPTGVSAATAAALAALKPASSLTSSSGLAMPPRTGAGAPVPAPSSSSSSTSSPGLAVLPRTGPGGPPASTGSGEQKAPVSTATAAGLAALKPASSTVGGEQKAPVSTATAAGLAALKPASSTVTGPDLPAPPRLGSAPPARPPTRATSTAETRAIGPAAPPTPLDTRPFKVAAVAVVAVIVVAVAIARRPQKVDSLPPIHLPVDAVDCRRVESEGRDLICVAEAPALNGLPADERARRLTLTRTLASEAGFARVVFRARKDRVWRIEDLTIQPATTTDRTPPPSSP